MSDVRYNFEYDMAGEPKLAVGFIGCGGHAWRNVYPAFQYAPVDLVSVCDHKIERAKAYARQFGARSAYASHEEMLRRERLDAVFIVTNYDEAGHPRSTALARDALAAGCHVWMEKPPAAGAAEIEELLALSRESGKIVLVGFKKMFFPAIEMAKRLIQRADFGRPTSVYIRYPQGLPTAEARTDDRAMVGFLDHIVHPGSILLYLMGPIASLTFLREGGVGDQTGTGATVSLLRFASGAVGTMHLTAGQSGTSPLERLEVVGKGANVVVDNGTRVTYYRPGSRGHYGRSSSFLAEPEQAPLFWEPEFSLGQLYNKNLFTLGYVPEVLYFCECVLGGKVPEKAGLEDALELMKLYEAYRGAEGETIIVNPSM